MPRGTPPNRLRELRERAGLSQREAADRINRLASEQGRYDSAATADMLSRWERGVVVPQPMYRRLLADLFDTPVEHLHLTAPPQPQPDFLETFVPQTIDPRVEHSHTEWRRTRAALNSHRHALAQVAASLYGNHQLGSTGLITHPGWLPGRPVDLAAVELHEHPDYPAPDIDGSGEETALVRPQQSLVKRYARYTQAIRDLAHPRLFENRMCWRLAGVDWSDGGGRMDFADMTYFGAVDVFEATAHELAYVALAPDGTPTTGGATMRDLPLRRLIGDPFDMTRRPLMPAISTLMIRAGSDGASFLLHRRDPRSVAAAGGMLQVIPSGIFQPSSILPAAKAADFDLWRNIMREYSEELLGNPEHDGDGQPVDYAGDPFATLDQARRDGRLRVYCLGVALDALTLVGEVLTVAVFDGDLFDALAGDFVDHNDEGSIVTTRAPFTETGIADLLGSGRMAPAGAGCLELAWRHRAHLL